MAIKRKVIRDKKPQASTQKPAAPVTPAIPDIAAVLSVDVQPDFSTTTPATTTPANTVVIQTGGKFRRLKNGVAKVSRFERDLAPSDRDTIIRWWNLNQRMIPDDDPICKTLADQINSSTRGKPLSSMQVAGYFSYLCSMGRWDEARRNARIARSKERGSFSVNPVYSNALIQEICENWERERADEAARRRAHDQIRAARQAGVRVRAADVRRQAPVTQTVIQTAPQPVAQQPPAPAASTPTTFDITWSR